MEKECCKGHVLTHYSVMDSHTSAKEVTEVPLGHFYNDLVGFITFQLKYTPFQEKITLNA